MSGPVLRIGVAGLGGYAAAVADHLLRVGEAAGVRLTAAADPQPVLHAARAGVLRDRGVDVVDDFDRLLALPIDAVWLPVPIGLHRPFTERALAAGKPVMVEKPAAGTVQDVDAMIDARDRAGLPVAVGFQTLFAPDCWRAKRRLLAGDVGRVRRASVLVCWPRGEPYYGRNAWAGRLRHGGAWVLDSPANNAMAHYLNLALFLLGPTPGASCEPAAVGAELYRANPIENYDTCTLRLTLPGGAGTENGAGTADGATLTVAMTHACETTVEPIVRVEGERGVLEYRHGAGYVLTRGGTEEPLDGPRDLHAAMVRGFAGLVRGDGGAEYASLENARAHTRVINAVSQFAAVHDVPPDAVDTVDVNGDRRRVVPGIERTLAACAADGRLLSETGLVPWAVGGTGATDLDGYAHFAGPAGGPADAR